MCDAAATVVCDRFERVASHDRAMEIDDRLVNVDELAAYLDVPVKTLYAWRHRRDGPPAFRVGRHLRYRWSDVLQWIDRQLAADSPRPGVGGRR